MLNIDDAMQKDTDMGLVAERGIPDISQRRPCDNRRIHTNPAPAVRLGGRGPLANKTGHTLTSCTRYYVLLTSKLVVKCTYVNDYPKESDER